MTRYHNMPGKYLLSGVSILANSSGGEHQRPTADTVDHFLASECGIFRRLCGLSGFCGVCRRWSGAWGETSNRYQQPLSMTWTSQLLVFHDQYFSMIPASCTHDKDLCSNLVK